MFPYGSTFAQLSLRLIWRCLAAICHSRWPPACICLTYLTRSTQFCSPRKNSQGYDSWQPLYISSLLTFSLLSREVRENLMERLADPATAPPTWKDGILLLYDKRAAPLGFEPRLPPAEGYYGFLHTHCFRTVVRTLSSSVLDAPCKVSTHRFLLARN